MVTMTSSAAEQLKSFVQSSGIAGGSVRLFLTGGGCCGPGFAVDVVPSPEAADVPVVQDGATLYVQKEAAALLENVVIDFQDTFVLRGLQTSGCCG
jgi:iron-sulfur cluster assembly accessory protein